MQLFERAESPISRNPGKQLLIILSHFRSILRKIADSTLSNSRFLASVSSKSTSSLGILPREILRRIGESISPSWRPREFYGGNMEEEEEEDEYYEEEERGDDVANSWRLLPFFRNFIGRRCLGKNEVHVRIVEVPLIGSC